MVKAKDFGLTSEFYFLSAKRNFIFYNFTMAEFFTDFVEAVEALKERGQNIHTYTLTLSPGETFNVRKVKEKTGANAVIVKWDKPKVTRFHLMDIPKESDDAEEKNGRDRITQGARR